VEGSPAHPQIPGCTADVPACPLQGFGDFDLLEEAMHSEITDESIEKFREDWTKIQ